MPNGGPSACVPSFSPVSTKNDSWKDRKLRMHDHSTSDQSIDLVSS